LGIVGINTTIAREMALEGHSQASALKTVQTILVIDDEADLVNTCARLLKGAGFECEMACTMDDALAKFDAKRPGLVLSDITLPDGDGFEITRYVRAKSPDTPVILMTAYHSAMSREEARRCGASQYLRKPFSNSELLTIVRSLLDQ
jgi:DNA-binding response OmpR family regulator